MMKHVDNPSLRPQPKTDLTEEKRKLKESSERIYTSTQSTEDAARDWEIWQRMQKDNMGEEAMPDTMPDPSLFTRLLTDVGDRILFALTTSQRILLRTYLDQKIGLHNGSVQADHARDLLRKIDPEEPMLLSTEDTQNLQNLLHSS